MTYNYQVSYSVYDGDQIYISETVGIRCDKNCRNTNLIAIIKSWLPGNKRKLPTVLHTVNFLSEEENVRLYGNSIKTINKRSRETRKKF